MEQQKLNPTIVYVLTILSLLCCCIWGVGFIFAGIAFYIAYTKLKDVEANPDNYDHSGVNRMNTAKIFALVMLIINLLYLLFCLYRVYTIGWDEIMERSREMLDQFQNS
jgi:hypothetical protein